MNKYKFKESLLGDIGLKKLKGKSSYKKIEKNCENYVNWVVNILNNRCNRELRENERYNALAIYMNQNNNDLLNKYLDPLVWLNYSPKVDDSLEDTEYSVDEDNLIVEE